MPLDPSIVQGLQPINIAPPDNSARMNQLAMLMKMQGLQSDNQLNQLKISGAQQGLEAQRRLQGLDLGTDEGRRAALGLGAPGINAVKAFADVQKNEGDRKTKDAALLDDRVKLYSGLASRIQTPDDAFAMLDAQYKDPLLGPVLGNIVHPDVAKAHLAQLLQQPDGLLKAQQGFAGMTVKEIMDAQVKQKELGVSQQNANRADAEFKDKQNNPPLSFQDTASGAIAFNPRTGGVTPLEVGGKPIPAKTGAEALSPLGKLKRERDALPPDSPDRAVYADAIDKSSETSGEKLSAVDQQKREAAYPKATLAVKQVETDAKRVQALIQDLRNNKDGLNAITGVVYGRTPSVSKEGRRAEAVYNAIIANGSLKALTDLRASSPTGGALGNVSDKDMQILKDAVGALDRKQSPEDLDRALKDLYDRLGETVTRSKDAFDLTYEYRNKAPANGNSGRPSLDDIFGGKR